MSPNSQNKLEATTAMDGVYVVEYFGGKHGVFVRSRDREGEGGLASEGEGEN